jgi:CheY-like chemotaxis protein
LQIEISPPGQPSRAASTAALSISLQIALLEEMVADLGHEIVGPVARLDKAVAMAQQEALDVVILDVNLNGQEVFPVAAALSARGIPFFFVTGYGRSGQRAPYADHPRLQKPFRRQALHDLFTKVCGAQQG